MNPAPQFAYDESISEHVVRVVMAFISIMVFGVIFANSRPLPSSSLYWKVLFWGGWTINLVWMSTELASGLKFLLFSHRTIEFYEGWLELRSKRTSTQIQYSEFDSIYRVESGFRDGPVGLRTNAGKTIRLPGRATGDFAKLVALTGADDQTHRHQAIATAKLVALCAAGLVCAYVFYNFGKIL
jgi:hypothetical protein